MAPAAAESHSCFMAQVHHLNRRPPWWGPDWLGLPVAFWLSVLTSAATTGVVAWVLLGVFVPELNRPIPTSFPVSHPRPRFASEFYAAIAFSVGALPPLYPWNRALHRRGLHSWDDD
ncbi:MAG: hypothetical protein JWO12_542 [Frankiales bacterium]|nr:hypothetical protein [Frankiales bacterium]